MSQVPPNLNSIQTSINSVLLLGTLWPIATARLTGASRLRLGYVAYRDSYSECQIGDEMLARPSFTITFKTRKNILYWIAHHSWGKGIWQKKLHQTTFWGLRSWNRVRWRTQTWRRVPKTNWSNTQTWPLTPIIQIEFHAPKKERTTKTLPSHAVVTSTFQSSCLGFRSRKTHGDGTDVLFQGHFSTQGALVYKSSSKVLRMLNQSSQKGMLEGFMAQVWVAYHSIHTHDKLVGGWTNPSEKHSSKLDHFPKFRC